MKKGPLYLTLVISLIMMVSCGGKTKLSSNEMENDSLCAIESDSLNVVEEDSDSIVDEDETGSEDVLNNNEHEWVDLGLSSGTKWATMNIGATSPSEYGDYFAWGELAPKGHYSQNGYEYPFADSDAKELPTSKDAAVAYWGEDWRMPSEAQFRELLKECDCDYETQDDGVVTLIAIGPNGNSIMLPLAGWKKGKNPIEDGEIARYYTRTRSISEGAFAVDGPFVFKASIGRTNNYDNGEGGYHLESIGYHNEEVLDMDPFYGFSIRAVYVGQ